MTATTSAPTSELDLTGCEPCVSRRVALAGVAGAAAVALAGCSAYGSSSDTKTTAAAAPSTGAASTGGSSPAAAGGGATASLSEVPVGGGIVLADAGLVLTQPEAGTVKAFTATCTHAGCQVNAVADGTINCPCHGSKYSISDGSVVNGPAKDPLTPKQVTVEGDSITVA